MNRQEALRELRRAIGRINGQPAFEALLIPDEDLELSGYDPIQRHWALLQWEIDEEIRRLHKVAVSGRADGP